MWPIITPRASHQGFNPAALPGIIAVYDASVGGTRWQDTSAATAAAGAGDPVARLNDLSANGYNLLQATSSKRYVYQTSGGLHWIEGDLVDDVLEAAIAAIAPSNVTAFFGLAHDGGGANFNVIGLIGGSGATRAAVHAPYFGAAHIMGFAFNGQNSSYSFGTAFNVLSCEWKAATHRKLWVNRSLVVNGAAPESPPGIFEVVSVGSDAISIPGPKKVSCAILLNGILSADNFAACEQWVAARSGVVLP